MTQFRIQSDNIGTLLSQSTTSRPTDRVRDDISLHIVENEVAMASAASQILSASLAANPDLALCLPTGNTPRPLYADLRQRYVKGQISFAQARIFMVDEYVGAAADADWSYSQYLDRELIDHIDCSSSNVFRMDGVAEDQEIEAQRFESAIIATGGLDFAVLGLGANGHVAFNEPGSHAEGTTHVVTLSPDTLVANGAFLPKHSRPSQAITIGLGTIRSSDAILLLVAGVEKQAALSALINAGDPNVWPVAALRDHPNLTVIATKEAAPFHDPNFK